MFLVVGSFFVAIILYWVKKHFLLKNQVETASAAFIMALGILLNESFDRLDAMSKSFSASGSFIVAVAWFYILLVILVSVWRREFYRLHVEAPLTIFAVGTWIASTSVSLLVFHHLFPGYSGVQRILEMFNFLMLFLYLAAVLIYMKDFRRNRFYEQVHGVVLLMTVSVQSVVIANSIFFQEGWIHTAQEFLFDLGLVLYTINFALLIYRYGQVRNWSITEDWKNTNCIIHGAISITGVAGIVSGTISMRQASFIWLMAAAMFILVEVMECIRAVKRVRAYGFRKGLGVYHVSQWARNFTFGMFLFFTMKMNVGKSGVSFDIIKDIQAFILSSGPWVVGALFVMECVIFLYQKVEEQYQSHEKSISI